MANYIVQELEGFAKLTEGNQKAFYQQKLADLKDVHVVPLDEVFTNEQIIKIKQFVRPKKKMCYRNAQRLCELFDWVKYVEGYSTIFDGTFPIEHAWNKVGDKYVDVTYELALKLDVTKETYMSLGVYDIETVKRVTQANEFFGDVYNYLFIEKLKKEKKL